MLWLWILVFIAAFFGLVKFSDLTVKEAVKFAQAYGITLLAVGFLLTSVSTSLPELAVSTISAVMHRNQLVLGNVLGSNIADILFIGGILGFVSGLRISKKQFNKLLYSLLLTSILSAVILFFREINWIVGIGFILAYSLFYYDSGKEKRVKGKVKPRDMFYFSVALIGLIVSSAFVVISVEYIDAYLKLSEIYMGALLIGFGTSLPELSVGLAAVKKKNYSLAIGDLIGSCVFNLGFVLGTSVIINPILYSLLNVLPLIFFLNLANLLFVIMLRKLRLNRFDAAILLSIYLIFVLFSSGLLTKVF